MACIALYFLVISCLECRHDGWSYSSHLDTTGERSRGISFDIMEYNVNICNSLQNFCYVNKMHPDLFMTLKFLSLVAKHISNQRDDQDDDLS